MLVYDITCRDTFDRLDEWLMELRTNAAQDIDIMLVGNKSDLPSPRAVSTDEAKAYAEENSMLFHETSAKDATNVESAFCKLITGQCMHMESYVDVMSNYNLRARPKEFHSYDVTFSCAF